MIRFETPGPRRPLQFRHATPDDVQHIRCFELLAFDGFRQDEAHFGTQKEYP